MIKLKNLQIYSNIHCNLSCVECIHHSQFNSPHSYKFDQFEKDIDVLKNNFEPFYMTIIMGGEPYLNKDLPLICKKIKKLKISEKTQINTNGTMLEKFGNELYDYVDNIIVSKYPLNERLTNKIESGLEYIKQFEHLYITMYETNEIFHTTVLKKNSDELTKDIYKKCSGGIYSEYSYTITIFDGNFYRCQLAIMKPIFLNKFKIESSLYKDISNDVMKITPSFSDEIFTKFYTNNGQPFNSCYWCVGCSLKSDIPHRQIESIEESLQYKDIPIVPDTNWRDYRLDLSKDIKLPHQVQ